MLLVGHVSGKSIKIILYVNSEKGFVRGAGAENLPPLGRFTFTQDRSMHVKKDWAGLSERTIMIRDWLMDMCEEHDATLKIIDVAKTRHIVRALLSGIRETPTVAVGSRRLSGNEITEEAIKEILTER